MMGADPENPQVLTWAALIGRWMEFARSAVALPGTGEGGRWRSSVPSIIALQALVHALGEADTLSSDERALALDKGELLVREHAGALNESWRSEPLPEQLVSLIDDARDALRIVRETGTEWAVVSGTPTLRDPTPLLEELRRIGFGGELWLARPGATLAPQALGAYARERWGGEPEHVVRSAIDRFLSDAGGVFEPSRTPVQRQAYAVEGDPGSFVVVAMDDDLPAGRPVLKRVGAAPSSGRA